MSKKKKVTRGNPAKAAVPVAKSTKSAKSTLGWVPSGSLGPAGSGNSPVGGSKPVPARSAVVTPKRPVNRKQARKQSLTKAFVVGMVVVLSAILAGSILVSAPSVQAPGQPYEVPVAETE